MRLLTLCIRLNIPIFSRLVLDEVFSGRSSREEFHEPDAVGPKITPFIAPWLSVGNGIPTIPRPRCGTASTSRPPLFRKRTLLQAGAFIVGSASWRLPKYCDCTCQVRTFAPSVVHFHPPFSTLLLKLTLGSEVLLRSSFPSSLDAMTPPAMQCATCLTADVRYEVDIRSS